MLNNHFAIGWNLGSNTAFLEKCSPSTIIQSTFNTSKPNQIAIDVRYWNPVSTLRRVTTFKDTIMIFHTH
ncbi:10877_t:CDS:1, partial [Funneliformis mosseae]